ncbi:MAG TPA: hypothetical protein VEA69_14975 [Tepidisphaeraceae bacterium]|nr:hypothetical protein [Tepidisphaeraceae bacterium]
MDIDTAFAAIRYAFPSTAQFQGTQFKYACRNGVTLVERKLAERYCYWLDAVIDLITKPPRPVQNMSLADWSFAQASRTTPYNTSPACRTNISRRRCRRRSRARFPFWSATATASYS